MAIRLLSETFLLPSCNRKFPRDIGKERPCLQLHMKKCCGVCTGALSPEAYQDIIRQCIQVLEGKSGELEEQLQDKMEQAAEEMLFEQAAVYRDRIRAIQKLRQSRFMESLPENWDVRDEAPLPEQRIESAEQASALRQAINSMSPEDRDLFIRVYFLEQTVEEIAAVTGQNASTLRVRLHRGRKKLRQILSERGICCD